MVTLACQSGSIPPLPTLPAASVPAAADATTPPQPRSPNAVPPDTAPANTPSPLAPADARRVRHRPAGTCSTETDPDDSDSPQRPPACAPASRSRDGIRSGACPGRAAAAAIPTDVPRTTLPLSPRTAGPRRVRRSSGSIPNRCCHAGESCCRCRHAPTLADTTRDGEPVAAVIEAVLPPAAWRRPALSCSNRRRKNASYSGRLLKSRLPRSSSDCSKARLNCR